MPLQNRVDPWGRLNAAPSRSALRMGNRGILHDASQRIVKPWAHRAWVCCLIDFVGKAVPPKPTPKVFSPGHYSQLFFLDEATAFAAGHRPCHFCQRERHGRFKAAWLAANLPAERHATTSTPHIDKALHAERAIRGGGKCGYKAALGELPFGAMFEHDGQAWLVARDGCRRWSFDGYGAPVAIASDTTVTVLTPRSIVLAFAAGFEPLLHASAAG